MPRTNPLTPAAARRPTNVTLPDTQLGEARELKINISQACERGLAQAVAETKARQWQAENQAAIKAWNEHVEQHRLPLARFRQF